MLIYKDFKTLIIKNMANICLLCDKGSRVVGKYSNSVRATKFNPCGDRRVYPNIQWARIPNGPRIRICTKCIKKGTYLNIALG